MERQVLRIDLGVEDKERVFQLLSYHKGTFSESHSWQQVLKGRKSKP